MKTILIFGYAVMVIVGALYLAPQCQPDQSGARLAGMLMQGCR